MEEKTFTRWRRLSGSSSKQGFCGWIHLGTQRTRHLDFAERIRILYVKRIKG
jgi:hypothetical protein